MVDRAAVVTGCGQGIGYAIAERLLRDGHSVVGIEIDSGLADSARASLEAIGTIRVVVGDVSEPAILDHAAAEAERSAPLRVWINNAGFNVDASVHDISPLVYERGRAVNLDAVFWGTASAVRRMLANGGGSIVNISSILASVGFAHSAAYAMAKGGIDALTRQVAAEYASRGIRCNAIAPGLIRTAMNERLLDAAADRDALLASWSALMPIGRWGEPADVAELAAFLASPERSGFLTGQVITLDGGATVLARGEPIGQPERD